MTAPSVLPVRLVGCRARQSRSPAANIAVSYGRVGTKLPAKGFGADPSIVSRDSFLIVVSGATGKGASSANAEVRVYLSPGLPIVARMLHGVNRPGVP